MKNCCQLVFLIPFYPFIILFAGVTRTVLTQVSTVLFDNYLLDDWEEAISMWPITCFFAANDSISSNFYSYIIPLILEAMLPSQKHI